MCVAYKNIYKKVWYTLEHIVICPKSVYDAPAEQWWKQGGLTACTPRGTARECARHDMSVAESSAGSCRNACTAH